MWIKSLKIALIEKNTDAIDKLLDEIPNLQDPQDVQTAIYLLKETSLLLHTLKDETANSMLQVKKNLEYLNSTVEKRQHKFEVKS